MQRASAVRGRPGIGRRISGNAQDGVYEAVATFPQFSEAGTWHVVYLEIDRKSGVEGRIVDLGGSRIVIKKNLQVMAGSDNVCSKPLGLHVITQTVRLCCCGPH